jgi:hypothetical protein
VLAGLFRLRASLEAEMPVLRRQLNVQGRHAPRRTAFSSAGRLIFAGLYGLTPSVLKLFGSIRRECVDHIAVLGERRPSDTSVTC